MGEPLHGAPIGEGPLERGLRFLHLEDDPLDGELVQASLRSSGFDFAYDAVRTRRDFEQALRASPYHVILSDYSLPGFDGASALALARQRQPEAAFIFVSGTIGEERAVESMKSGATDYVLKAHLDRLGPVVRRALREAHSRVERRRAEQALRENQVLLKLALQAANIGSWDWNLQTDNLVVSPEWKAQLGYGDDEIRDELAAWTDHLHPDDRMRVLAQVEGCRTGVDGRLDIDYRLRHKDGSYRWVQTRGMLLRDPAGRPTRVLGCHLDVTDRKHNEQQLRDQAVLLDAANDAIYVYDPDGTILYWNRAAEKLYGWASGEAVGRRISQVLPADPVASRTIQRTLASQGSWSGELNETSRSGNPRVVYSTRTLVPDEHGQSARVLTIDVDLAEKKKLEAQFLRAQRVEAVGTLASGIAHDLNNILAPILMSVGLLEDEIRTEDGRETLSTLRTCSERGAALVRQVLSFARGITGQRIPVNPVHLLRDIEKLVRETFPKNIAAAFLPEPNIWSVVGDPTQLHQVFMNLCVNARDAMPEGGTLTVRAKNAVFDEVRSPMNPDARPGSYVVISVADTGTGIPPEVREHIFEPFFTTKDADRGTGLGLSTTLTIVRSHGGFIDLESEPGKGTKFCVCFPASPESNSAGDAAETAPATLPRGHGELILVVDDEEGIRKVVRDTLEHHGYRVLLAEHGADALALYTANRGRIDVVLTDMAMPVMDGPSTIVALRAINPDVKVIGSSGLGESATKAAHANVRHLIAKPYTTETLVETVARVLRGE